MICSYKKEVIMEFNSSKQKNSLSVSFTDKENIDILVYTKGLYKTVMVSQKGFEPPTHGLEGRCSIQLSY